MIKYRVASSAPTRPAQTHVRLTIYDLLGRHLITLVDQSQSPGEHAVRWDGRAKDGKRVGAGVYLYELRAGEVRMTKKMIVLE